MASVSLSFAPMAPNVPDVPTIDFKGRLPTRERCSKSMAMAHFVKLLQQLKLSMALRLLLCLFMMMPCSLLWLALVADLNLKGAAAMSPDGLALLQFKGNMRNGDDVLSSWNANDENPCDGWLGVTCVPGTNHSVSQLKLNNGGLNGTLSRSLGSLPNLTLLHLYGHTLSGPIPSEIGNAKLLTFLDLGANRLLSGSIPASINGLQRLTALGMWGNSLTGSIPNLDGLTNLEVLYLNENDFSGPFPNMSVFPHLRELYLGGNRYSSDPAPDLANLHSMERLGLSRSEIEGPLPTWIGSMPNLLDLEMDGNRLSGQIPEDIWGNKSLHRVQLSGNRLNGSIPAQLLHQLQAGQASLLNLSNNALTGGIPDTLNIERGPGPNWLSVDVSNNQLDGPIPSTFVRGELIERLWLHNNRLSGDIASDWAAFESTSLSELRLEGNLFSGELGPATCARWEKLKILDLSGNVGIRLVNDSLTFMLNSLTLLQVLGLSGVRGSGKLPTSNRTSPFTELRVLDLSRSGLEDDLSQSLLMANAHLLFPNLQFLDLSGNALTGAIPLSFSRMPNLTFLNLSDNLLSGQMPLNSPPILRNASFFAGNPGLCGPPLGPCLLNKKQNGLVLKLAAGLAACVVLFAGTCLFFTWRLRLYAKRHQQDADLIAVLKSTNLMPLTDLRKATSNFSRECQIGVGGFGEVYKGKLNDGTLVAIKKSKKQADQRDKDQFLSEVKILSQVNHRNLVQLLGCCLANKVALLVFEFVPNGTLEEHLRSTTPGAPPLTWMERLRIALQTADALAYLHSAANPPIFHRDVKSANILLDQNMDAKVADFGISKLAPLGATHVSTVAVQGTPGYIDPEYYVSYQLSAKSDVFSFGVVLLELISGRAALESERRSEDASLIGVAVPLIKSHSVDQIIDPAIFQTSFQSAADGEKVKESVAAVGALAVKCLALKSKDRPSMREVFKDLQILWLQFDASTTLDFSDQLELGSGLSGLENLSDQDCIDFLNSRSFHGSSTTLSDVPKLQC